MAKDAITPDALPSHCRRWDDKRRVWVPKARYADQSEAKKAVQKGTHVYKCITGNHFHVGHTSKGKRRGR